MTTEKTAAPDQSTRRNDVRVLSALLAVGLVIRLIGIIWRGVHPDENFGASAKVLAGQLVPDFHYYPPLLDYLNAVVYAAMFAAGYLTGFWADTEAFREQYFSNPTPFVFAGRLPTVFAGAVSAPLAGILARRLGAPLWAAALAGLAVAILPANVMLSHYSKSDMGMAASFVLMAYTYLRTADGPSSWRNSLAFAGSCVLAVSFKHSAFFLVAPLFCCYLFQLCWIQRLPLKDAAKFAAGWIAASVVLWIPLNIGIVLDFGNFIEFQRVQALISRRESGISTLMTDALPKVGPSLFGASTLVLLIWFVSPLWMRTWRYLSLWSSLLAGMLIVAVLAGTRITDGLFIAHVTLIVAMACSSLAVLTGAPARMVRVGAAAALLIIIATYVPVTAEIKRQSLHRSTQSRKLTETVLSVATPGETRVLGGQGGIRYPIDPQAEEDDFARHVRLAEKYGVELPERSEERARRRSSNDERTPLYVRAMPFVFGGLEVYEEDEVSEVKPFAWPPQPEEYTLDYWIDQGFSVFVVPNEAGFLKSESRFYRQRFQEIRDRCELVAVIEPERPLFGDAEIRVYTLPPELTKRARAALRQLEAPGG